MTNKTFIFILITLITFFFSCNKDEKVEPAQADITELSGINIIISEINMTDVKIEIPYTSNSLNYADVNTKVLYKLPESPTYTEVDEGVIANLLPGKKYMVKGILELNGKQKDTEELYFTTLGFKNSGLTGTVEYYEKGIYEIWDDRASANFTEIENLNGYFKVGNDSLPLDNIEIINDNYLHLTIPKNTQQFFDNDNEHIVNKEFSISLKSGEYITKVKSQNGVTSKFWVEDTSHFTIYNKTPFIDAQSPTVIYTNCEGNDKVQIAFYGGFGGFPDAFVYIIQESYKEVEITISANETDNHEVLTILDYSSMVARTEQGGRAPYICEKEEFKANESFWERFKSMTLTFNVLILNLDEVKYPEGNYSIQLKGTYGDGTTFNSNKFEFKME